MRGQHLSDFPSVALLDHEFWMIMQCVPTFCTRDLIDMLTTNWIAITIAFPYDWYLSDVNCNSV